MKTVNTGKTFFAVEVNAVPKAIAVVICRRRLRLLVVQGFAETRQGKVSKINYRHRRPSGGSRDRCGDIFVPRRSFQFFDPTRCSVTIGFARR